MFLLLAVNFNVLSSFVAHCVCAHNTPYLIIAYNIIKYNSLLLFVSSKSKFCHNAQPRRFSPFSPIVRHFSHFSLAKVEIPRAIPHICAPFSKKTASKAATLIFRPKSPIFPIFYAICQICPKRKRSPCPTPRSRPHSQRHPSSLCQSPFCTLHFALKASIG
jgi:hypothetical protein